MIALLALLAIAPAATLDVPDDLVEGRPVTLRVEPPSAELEVVYRPSSVISETVALPVGPDGRVLWEPEHAGISTLRLTAGDETVERTVSVHYARVPISGVLTFLIAGGVLFGGVAFGFGRLLRGREEQDLEVAGPPMDA